MNEKIVLRRTERLRTGHQWVFSNEIITDIKKITPGSIVELYDTKDRYFGIGYLNPHSLIAVRLLSNQREVIDKDFFHKRIIDALNYRKKLMLNDNSLRLIYSEGDFLPGLVVDKYSECLVIQILTLGMELLRDTVIDILDELIKPSSIVLRNDSPRRNLEGLPSEIKIIKGNLDSLPIIKEDDILFEVNPLYSQKTGFFLDQAENRIAFTKYINGGSGLDVFCNTGAWGLHLAKKGCRVIGIDESEKALLQAKRNAELNGLEEDYGCIKAEAFSFLHKELKEGKIYDFIILDPPAFVKSRQKIKEAIRGYRDLNSRALKLLKKNGVLATSSCSHHIDKQTFIEIIASAAMDADKNPRLLEFRSQNIDHPVLFSVPETEYLKCAFIAV